MPCFLSNYSLIKHHSRFLVAKPLPFFSCKPFFSPPVPVFILLQQQDAFSHPAPYALNSLTLTFSRLLLSLRHLTFRVPNSSCVHLSLSLSPFSFDLMLVSLPVPLYLSVFSMFFWFNIILSHQALPHCGHNFPPVFLSFH